MCKTKDWYLVRFFVAFFLSLHQLFLFDFGGFLAKYPFMTEVLKFKFVKLQNFKYSTTVECARKLADPLVSGTVRKLVK